jgi:hypothetical protein
LESSAEVAKKILFVEKISANVVIDSAGIGVYYEVNKENYNQFER